MKQYTYNKSESGTTIFEVIVVLSLVSILSTVALLKSSAFVNQSEASAESLVVYLKSMRNLAMSRTQAVIIYPQSSTVIARKSANSCSDENPVPESFVFKLPKNINLRTTDWSICFTSRGLTNASQTFTLSSSTEGLKTIEISLGGSVRML